MAKKNGKKNGAIDPVTGEPEQRTSGAPIVDDEGFEIIGGDSTPMQIGEVVVGVYGGEVRSFKGRKGQVPIYQIGARTIMGGAVLTNRIKDGKVEIGDILKVTRIEDAPAKKGQNPAKMYEVRVKRASAGAQ